MFLFNSIKHIFLLNKSKINLLLLTAFHVTIRQSVYFFLNIQNVIRLLFVTEETVKILNI